MSESITRRKVTIQQLREMKRRSERIVVLGVYDAVTTSIAEQLGVDVLMTGPSGPMSLFGHTNPTQIGFEEQLVTLQAVTRVARYALTNAHMPYLSYHASERDAVLNAGRLISEGGADTVKCDANRYLANNIRAIASSGIPVIAHIGLQASRRIEQSGYGLKGRTAEDGKRIVDDAWALVEAGVFAILVEHAASEVMAHLTKELPVPTISLGSGPDADGICIVSGDAINYTVFPRPVHATGFADVRNLISCGLKEYAARTRDGTYPTSEKAPQMNPEEYIRFQALMSERGLDPNA